MTNLWFIQNVDLFDIFCAHDVEVYKNAHAHEFKNFKKNEIIYFEGDAANDIYLIASGKVRIGYYRENGEEVLKAILTKGEIFGELALLGETKRNEFAQAVGHNTSLCPLNLKVMNELLDHDKTLAVNIYKWIGLRIKRIERRLDLLIFKDVKTRLKEFLYELGREYGRKVGTDIVVKHSFTQKDIGNLIGASRQTVNQLLAELELDRIITVKGKLIILKEAAGELAAG